jgi:hypothetical protein
MNIKCDSQDFVELEKSCWCKDFFNAPGDDAFQFLSCNEMLIKDKDVLIVSNYSEVDFFTKAPLKKEVVTKTKELITPYR